MNIIFLVFAHASWFHHLYVVVGKSNINILIFALSQLSKTIKSIFFIEKEQLKTYFVIFAPCFKHLLRKKDLDYYIKDSQ